MRVLKRNALAAAAMAVLMSVPAVANWQERASPYDVATGRATARLELRLPGPESIFDIIQTER